MVWNTHNISEVCLYVRGIMRKFHRACTIRGLRVCTISYTWDWPQFAEEVPHLEEFRPNVRNTIEAAVFKPISWHFVCNNFSSSSSLTGSKVEDHLLTIQFDQHFHYWFQRLLSNLLNLPLSIFYRQFGRLYVLVTWEHFSKNCLFPTNFIVKKSF